MSIQELKDFLLESKFEKALNEHKLLKGILAAAHYVPPQPKPTALDKYRAERDQRIQ